jgi:citrate synthase
LNLFKTSNAKEFGSQIVKFKAILEAEGLTIEDAIEKKSYIEICKLDLEKSCQSYQELSTLLNVRFAAKLSSD